MKTLHLTMICALALSACNREAEAPAPAAQATATATAAALQMGDDTSEYANDNECDDARFIGSGMAAGLVVGNIGRDATDCQRALDGGTITLDPLFNAPASDAAIVYGDDNGAYDNNGECDDIRFTGDYAADMIYLQDDIGHDATDCRKAVEAGTARWQGNTPTPVRGRSAG